MRRTSASPTGGSSRRTAAARCGASACCSRCPSRSTRRRRPSSRARARRRSTRSGSRSSAPGCGPCACAPCPRCSRTPIRSPSCAMSSGSSPRARPRPRRSRASTTCSRRWRVTASCARATSWGAARPWGCWRSSTASISARTAPTGVPSCCGCRSARSSDASGACDVTASSAPLRFLAILGPTASGKSAAAPARVAMRNIAARGRVPIVVGGTGLYFRALTHGFFAAPPADPAIRARHREEAAALGVEALHARLEGVDASAAAVIGRRDLMRISRALEIYEQTGVPITALRLRAAPPADLAPRVLVLDPPLAELRPRIAARAARMFAAGFEDEVRALRAAGYGPALRPLQALGYPQVSALLDGTCTRDEALAATIAATVAYARRQRTWFRKEAVASRLEGAPRVAELAGTLALELAS